MHDQSESSGFRRLIIDTISCNGQYTQTIKSLIILTTFTCSFYEQLAVGVLSECYNSNPKSTSQLLVREVETFGKTTTLQLAVEAKNMEFVAHPASQAVLTKIWMGQLVEDNHPLAVKHCINYML